VRALASIAVATLILVAGPVHRSAHRAEHRDAPVSCRLIALPGNSFTTVGVPDAKFRHFLTSPATATFQVTYVGFGSFPAAQTAFQAALDIWAHLIVSSVPIKVRAEFTSLPSNVLGTAGGQFIWRDFPGAPISGTWYVDALADELSGGDVNAGNPGAFDILASFNSFFANWYFGTDGMTPGGHYDFVSVALHELAHGLGYSGSASVNGQVGSIGFSGIPTIYDRFTITETGTPLLSLPNPSVALGTPLTSGYDPANPRGPGSYWGGPVGSLGNGELSARLYTPSTWTAGSSYSHLDENTYPAGNLNSLMTFGIGQAEAIHDPGPVSLGMLDDSGWALSSPPLRPGSFSKTSPGDGATGQPTTLSLAWSSSSGATSYEYCIDSTLNFSCSSTWTNVGSATSVGVSGLSVGTMYEWQVRAQNPAGTSLAGGWFNFTTQTTPTRIIALSGSLDFGSTVIGSHPTRTFTIHSTGNSPLTVSGISFPVGFAGNWSSGIIAAGGAQDVIVTFSPASATGYGGLISVQANQTAGTPTINASGTGIGCLTAPPAPDWVCVNGNWLPPGFPGTTSPPPVTPPPTPPSPTPPPPTSCPTQQPAPDWVCVNGNWLPAGFPGTTPPAPAPPPSPEPPPPTPPAPTPPPPTGCASPQPAVDWVCVNGNWLPPGFPGAAPPAPPPAPTPTPPAPTGCSGSDPFLGLPGLAGVCINGGWIPTELIQNAGATVQFHPESGGFWALHLDDGRVFVPLGGLAPAFQMSGLRVTLTGKVRIDLPSTPGAIVEVLSIF
jgi:hypothetical protein